VVKLTGLVLLLMAMAGSVSACAVTAPEIDAAAGVGAHLAGRRSAYHSRASSAPKEIINERERR
jgi:hypothetical protein